MRRASQIHEYLRRAARNGYPEQVRAPPCKTSERFLWLIREYKLGVVGKDFRVIVDEFPGSDGSVYFCFKPEHADIAFAFKMRWA